MLSIVDVETLYALYHILVSICVIFECLIHNPWLAPWNVYFQQLNPLNLYIQQFNYGMYTFHSLSIECMHSTVLAIECIHSTVIYIQCNIYMSLEKVFHGKNGNFYVFLHLMILLVTTWICHRKCPSYYFENKNHPTGYSQNGSSTCKYRAFTKLAFL